MNVPRLPDGVTADAWAAIGAEVSGDGWRIPERDADGAVIGWATRSAVGEKKAVKGSKRGLTMLSDGLCAYAGTSRTEPVFIVEGATDTAAGIALGLDVVGRPSATGGADLLKSLLRDRHVCIIAENDASAGRTGALAIGEKLLGVAASVRIIYPSDGIKDLRAWTMKGATKAEVLARADDAELVRRSDPSADGAPVIVRLSEVEAREVRWLWEGRIPSGRLSLLAGRPGEGKSMVTMDWAARVTTGRPWPDGLPCPLGSVVLVAGEDDPADTIRPRLDAHGADSTRVHLLRGVTRAGPKGGTTEAAFTLADLDALEKTLAAVRDCELVIVDPIGSFIGGGVDAHRDNEVRAVLAPLAALAERTGAAVLLVAHQRKGAASHADDLVLGSRAFTGIARSVIHLLVDPDDKGRRLLLPGKANLSAPAEGLAFTIGGNPARVEWEPDPVNMTADGVLSAQADGGGDGGRTKRDVAEEWLRDLLSDGPRAVVDLEAEAKAAGFTRSTLRRARQSIGVVPLKAAFGGGWMCALPHTEDAHSPKVRTEGAQLLTSEHLGEKQAKNDGTPPKALTGESVSNLGEHLEGGGHLRIPADPDGWGEVA